MVAAVTPTILPIWPPAMIGSKGSSVAWGGPLTCTRSVAPHEHGWPVVRPQGAPQAAQKKKVGASCPGFALGFAFSDKGLTFL